MMERDEVQGIQGYPDDQAVLRGKSNYHGLNDAGKASEQGCQRAKRTLEVASCVTLNPQPACDSAAAVHSTQPLTAPQRRLKEKVMENVTSTGKAEALVNITLSNPEGELAQGAVTEESWPRPQVTSPRFAQKRKLETAATIDVIPVKARRPSGDDGLEVTARVKMSRDLIRRRKCLGPFQHLSKACS